MVPIQKVTIKKISNTGITHKIFQVICTLKITNIMAVKHDETSNLNPFTNISTINKIYFGIYTFEITDSFARIIVTLAAIVLLKKVHMVLPIKIYTGNLSSPDAKI